MLKRYQCIENRVNIAENFALRQWPEQFEQAFRQRFSIDVRLDDIIVPALGETIKYGGDQGVTDARQRFGGPFVVGDILRSLYKGKVGAFPPFEHNGLIL